MIRHLCVSVVLTALTMASCKPKAQDSGSSTNAIVGQENGKNKAMAIVAVRNNTNINTKMPDNAGGKIVLNKVFETYYALVECSDDNRAKADTWMNLLEFYGLSSVLYVDGDRRLHMNRTGSGEKIEKIFFDACTVVGKNFLTLPMLLSSASMADDFPNAEPKDEALKDQYLLLQSIYLAIRGPYSSSGSFAISPSLVGMAATSKAYPALAFTETQMGKTFAGSDYFYNPCVTKKVKTDKGYMQDWKMNYFSCVKATASKDLFNYKPGGLVSYTMVKEKLKYGMLTLYASTQGGISAKSSKADKLTAALMTTESWNEVEGPVKNFAAFLAGTKSYTDTFSDSLGLTDDEGAGFSLSGGDGDEPVSFGLADSKTTKRAPSEAQKKAAQLQSIDEGKKILNYLKNPELSPNFSRFAFIDNATVLNRYGARSEKEANFLLSLSQGKISELEAIRAKALSSGDKSWTAAKELDYNNERSKLIDAALTDLSTNNTVQQTATFEKKDYVKEFGVESVMSQNKQVYLTQTAQGKLTEFNKLSTADTAAIVKANAGIPADSTLWIDRTLQAKEGAEKVSWQKNGVGGQIVKTEGLSIQSDFQGNKRPDGTLSNIGVFTLNDKQLASATSQIEKLAAPNLTAINAANANAAKANTNVGQEAVVQGALDNLPKPNTQTTQGAMEASDNRQTSNYWNQLSAGFGQMGAGLGTAADASGKINSITDQVNQLSQNTNNANNASFFKTAQQAQTTLQTTAGTGLSTAWDGTKNAASATGSLVSDAYQNNSMFKAVSDYSGATAMASTASAAWGGVSSMWNSSGSGATATAAPAPAIPAGIQNPGGVTENGSTTSPYGNTTAPDASPTIPDL